MAGVTVRDQRYAFLATALATRGEIAAALAIAIGALVVFGVLVPFVRVPLTPFPAFIPSYEAALFFIDAFTALLLFDQFVRLKSSAILVLACGYFFDALMTVAHALSFPGAFSPAGLLGAKEQTTAWLYVFWHGGFPLFVIGYAVLRRLEEKSPLRTFRTGWAIGFSLAVVALLVVGLVVLTTWGHDLLPIVMRGSDYSLLVSKGISPGVWAITLVALLTLWRRKPRVVDLWLMVVMWVWLFDIALAAVIGSKRFDLGFYAGRVFGLIAASFLLMTLLAQMLRLHAEAVDAAASAEARLAKMGRQRAPAAGQATAKEDIGSFVHRQNVEHYRALLQSGTLDDAQRLAIEKLLAEAEAEEPPGTADRA